MAKTEPTGAEWKSRENADGVTEWTLVRLGGATLPHECRAVVTMCGNSISSCVYDIEIEGQLDSRQGLERAQALGLERSAKAMAARFRRLARRLAQ